MKTGDINMQFYKKPRHLYVDKIWNQVKVKSMVETNDGKIGPTTQQHQPSWFKKKGLLAL